MLKVAVGSASAYKISAVQKVLAGLEQEFELFPLEVNTGVSEQPSKTGETQVGSINRAKAALAANPQAELGLGIEFGYEPFEDSYRMVCWAAIVDKAGLQISEHSSSLQVPEEFRAALDSNPQVDINDLLEPFYASLPNNEASRHFIGFIKKRRVIYECVENVFLRYIFSDRY
jgi:non-canonical (house-cleaning) NTP pyrophosphatase